MKTHTQSLLRAGLVAALTSIGFAQNGVETETIRAANGATIQATVLSIRPEKDSPDRTVKLMGASAYRQQKEELAALVANGGLTPAEYAKAVQKILTTSVFRLGAVDAVPQRLDQTPMPLVHRNPGLVPPSARFSIRVDAHGRVVSAILLPQGDAMAAADGATLIAQMRFAPARKDQVPVSTEFIWIAIPTFIYGAESLSPGVGPDFGPSPRSQP